MSQFTHSQILRAKIEIALPTLRATVQTIEEHPQFSALFSEYLFTLHCMIRASVPLMQAALERAQTLSSHDPVAGGLATYLAQHIPEELHHDDWLLDDLAVLGMDRAQVLSRLPSPAIASLVGSQYYWIHHYHPLALLGYMAVLEGYPATAEQIEAQVITTGHPRAAFRTLFKHAVLDPHHRSGLDQALDSLPLTREHSVLLGVSALRTVELASYALQELVR